MASFTSEQKAFMFTKSRVAVALAKAGTGKTSTCRGYARVHPNERILYLVYNSENSKNAKKTFPPNVTPRTIHALAYSCGLGQLYRHKLSSFGPSLRQIANLIDSNNWTLIKRVQNTVNKYMNSSDVNIERTHTGLSSDYNKRELEQTIAAANTLWSEIRNPKNSFPISHDGYLKEFQLCGPDLSLLFDTIILDESQDTNQITASIVLAQKTCKLLFVGDEHQNIYRYRGAENIMKYISDLNPEVYHLTQSFRFGAAVAEVANDILFHKKNTHALIGLDSIKSEITSKPFSIDEKYTKLHRTVFGALASGLKAAANNLPTHWIGKLESYHVEQLLDLYYLKVELKDKIINKRLPMEFPTYAEYVSVASQSRDHEMEWAVRVLNEFKNIPELVSSMRKHEVSDPAQAMLIISTAHKAKGLEWPNVELGSDFPDLGDPEISDEITNDELNLLYVASTRAIHKLLCNEIVNTLRELAKNKRTIFDLKVDNLHKNLLNENSETTRKPKKKKADRLDVAINNLVKEERRVVAKITRYK